MVFNATFNNIWIVAWWSVLLMEEISTRRVNWQHEKSQWKVLILFFIYIRIKKCFWYIQHIVNCENLMEKFEATLQPPPLFKSALVSNFNMNWQGTSLHLLKSDYCTYVLCFCWWYIHFCMYIYIDDSGLIIFTYTYSLPGLPGLSNLCIPNRCTCPEITPKFFVILHFFSEYLKSYGVS